MTVRNILIASLIVASLSCSNALATLMPAPDVAKVTQASSLIVLGELTAVKGNLRSGSTNLNDGQTINVRVAWGIVCVDQVLKGDPRGTALSYEFSVPMDQFRGWRHPMDHSYGLFFLKPASTDGTWEPTNPYDGWIPTPRGINVSGTTALDRAIGVLGTVISVPDSSPDMKTIALDYLDFDRSDSSRLALRAVLGNPDPHVGLNAARALMLRGDASGMDVIKRAFLPGPQALPDSLEETIPNVISVGTLDPQLIPDLEQLLNSTSRYVRKGVTIALMKMESPYALNALRRALADSDVEVRYYGLLGLGRITDGDGAMLPQMEQFKADESKYVGYWRDRPAKHK
jgi:hypothetical protein